MHFSLFWSLLKLNNKVWTILIKTSSPASEGTRCPKKNWIFSRGDVFYFWDVCVLSFKATNYKYALVTSWRGYSAQPADFGFRLSCAGDNASCADSMENIRQFPHTLTDELVVLYSFAAAVPARDENATAFDLAGRINVLLPRKSVSTAMEQQGITLQTFKTGFIMALYADAVPDGWLMCDGAPLDAEDYPDLARLVGSHVPDLRGSLPLGKRSDMKLGTEGCYGSSGMLNDDNSYGNGGSFGGSSVINDADGHGAGSEASSGRVLYSYDQLMTAYGLKLKIKGASLSSPWPQSNKTTESSGTCVPVLAVNFIIKTWLKPVTFVDSLFEKKLFDFLFIGKLRLNVRTEQKNGVRKFPNQICWKYTDLQCWFPKFSSTYVALTETCSSKTCQQSENVISRNR